MAKIPDIKRIAKEDFEPEYQGLIDRLAFPINSFMEQVRNAFNGNIDFTNLAQEVQTISFITNENGQPMNKISFKTKLTNAVQGINIINVKFTNNANPIESLPFINFSQNDKTINISYIGGLKINSKYQITLQLI